MPKLLLTFDDAGDATIELPPPKADTAAFFAFGIHKCGSSLLSKLFRDIAAAAGIPDVGLSEQLFGIGHPDPDLTRCTNLTSILSDGYCYRAFRVLPPGIEGAPVFLNSKKILLVRDPRDAIVSAYFSFIGGSHLLPAGGDLLKQMDEWRKEHSQLSIEQYAKRFAPNFCAKFRAYQEAFEGLDNVRTYRYEDIIFEKRSWVDDMLDFLGLQLPGDFLDSMVEAVDIRPSKEDPNAHIRKVTPGDHREKLSPDTIAEISGVLAGQLSRLGYTVN